VFLVSSEMRQVAGKGGGREGGRGGEGGREGGREGELTSAGVNPALGLVAVEELGGPSYLLRLVVGGGGGREGGRGGEGGDEGINLVAGALHCVDVVAEPAFSESLARGHAATGFTVGGGREGGREGGLAYLSQDGSRGVE